MKTITKDKIQFSFDPAVTPVETIEAGEMICFQTQDCYAEQIDHDRKDFTLLDMKRNNPITGPLFVNGAVPGRESQNQSGRESKERMHYGISETLLHLTRIKSESQASSDSGPAPNRDLIPLRSTFKPLKFQRFFHAKTGLQYDILS